MLLYYSGGTGIIQKTRHENRRKCNLGRFDILLLYTHHTQYIEYKSSKFTFKALLVLMLRCSVYNFLQNPE